MLTSLDTINLQSEITELRNIMIHTGQENGLTHPATIKCSQELDKLIIRYEYMILNEGMEA